jgi:hypothetical protein
MSNIPQETIDKITKDAEVKTEAKAKEIIGQFMPRSTNYIAFLDGYEEGRIDGATEWAGMAQSELIPALNELRIRLYLCRDTARELDYNNAILLIETALDKYKEVSNGE